jgi:hypothetical protein
LSRPGQGADEELVKHIILELQAVQCRQSGFLLWVTREHRLAPTVVAQQPTSQCTLTRCCLKGDSSHIAQYSSIAA